jgi:hydroxymethylbilane synthase
MKIRIATRGSKLALTQTRWVASRLQELHPGLEVEEVVIVTKGDKITDVPLARVGGKGLFVSEVEEAIADGRADMAVHSMKDVPADLAAGMAIVCVPEREDPRDVLVTRDGSDLDDLEAGSKIGTGSLRRICQLRQRRNDLDYQSLRGNVDTRLRKLEEGVVHGIVLAAAGLNRLGLGKSPGKSKLRHLPTNVCLPAVGQGALALEARLDDVRIRKLLEPLEDADTRVATEAERVFLGRLEGGCQVPIAGHARVGSDGALLRFDGVVGSVDGSEILSAGSERYVIARDPGTRIHAARVLGEEVAEALLTQGATRIIQEARAAAVRDGILLH